MRSILNLFGKSPFGPLQRHMAKVNECAQHITPLFDALFAGDEAGVARVAAELSRLENEADEIKNGIRTHLPKSLFLPVDRGDLLTLLGTADGIADFSEDLGILLTMRSLRVPDSLRDPLRLVVHRALATAAEADRLLDQLDELVEASFGGPEAKMVGEMIDNLGRLEHECDRAQWEFARSVFAMEKDLSAGELWMFLKLGQTLGNLANAAENVGKRLQLMLHV